MTAPVFVDTNIWFYALSAGDETKRLAANHLLDSLAHPVVNSQVIRELCLNLLRKSSYDEPAIQELVITSSHFNPEVKRCLGQQLLLHRMKVMDAIRYSHCILQDKLCYV